jgi:hypothetical protein
MPAIWYAPAAFETFVFSLTAYRAWGDAALITGTPSAPLLVLLYRGTFSPAFNQDTSFQQPRMMLTDFLYRRDDLVLCHGRLTSVEYLDRQCALAPCP